MEKTLELATAVLTALITEDRAPTQEEKATLAALAGIVLFDLHSIAGSLKRIADTLEEKNA